MALFISNVAPVFSVASAKLAHSTSDVLDISDITQYFDHVKSSSISQLIKGKTRDLQKLLTYFNGAITSRFNLLLLFDVFPINFLLNSKDLLVVVFLFDCYLMPCT